MNSATKVFISYAREDIELAKKIYDDLKREGIIPWLDSEDILPGQDWKIAINQAIKESNFFLALLSSNSISKNGFVQKELKIAFDVLDNMPQSEIFIIPARLDKCQPSEERLVNIHWADIFPHYEKGLKQILRVLVPKKLDSENNYNNNKIRVLIADDHAVVRQGLRKILEEWSDMEVVGEAGDGTQAIRKVKALKPDVVLIDIEMPELTGLEAIELMKEAVPNTKVIIVSMHNKDAYVHQALSYGASGYILKAAPESELLDGIRMVHRGNIFLSSKINSKLINAFLKRQTEKPAKSCYDLLSDRESQVFRFLVEGKSAADIADILSISINAVKKHQKITMRKLDLDNMVSMVKYAIKIGVIGPELWEDI